MYKKDFHLFMYTIYNTNKTITFCIILSHLISKIHLVFKSIDKQMLSIIL